MSSATLTSLNCPPQIHPQTFHCILLAVLILPFDLVTWCQIAVSCPLQREKLEQYELVVVSFVVGRHFEREEAGQQGDNVGSQQVLSSAPLLLDLLPLRTFGRLGGGRCGEGSLTYYIINQGEKNTANGEKRFQIRKG